MLFIQYLLFVVLFPGGDSLILLFWGIFVFIYDLYWCLLSLFIFFYFLGI